MWNVQPTCRNHLSLSFGREICSIWDMLHMKYARQLLIAYDARSRNYTNILYTCRHCWHRGSIDCYFTLVVFFLLFLFLVFWLCFNASTVMSIAINVKVSLTSDTGNPIHNRPMPNRGKFIIHEYFMQRTNHPVLKLSNDIFPKTNEINVFCVSIFIRFFSSSQANCLMTSMWTIINGLGKNWTFISVILCFIMHPFLIANAVNGVFGCFFPRAIGCIPLCFSFAVRVTNKSLPTNIKNSFTHVWFFCVCLFFLLLFRWFFVCVSFVCMCRP